MSTIQIIKRLALRIANEEKQLIEQFGAAELLEKAKKERQLYTVVDHEKWLAALISYRNLLTMKKSW